jgi:hypothetical protein
MKVKYIAEDGAQFDTEKECIAYEKAPVFYCIKNTVDEYNERITRFCSTFEEAKRELKLCRNWYDTLGTGSIYAIKLDTNREPHYEQLLSVNGAMLP